MGLSEEIRVVETLLGGHVSTELRLRRDGKLLLLLGRWLEMSEKLLLQLWLKVRQKLLLDRDLCCLLFRRCDHRLKRR